MVRALLISLALLVPLAACDGTPDDDDATSDDDDATGDDDDATDPATPCDESLVDVASTTSGCVQGSTSGGVTLFFGIPYAAPPVGDLRWRRTEPVQPWTEPLDATGFGDVCPQTNGTIGGEFGPGDGGEDCLSLNIWTPDSQATDLPVLFFTHGGSHTDGAGSQSLYRGASLATAGAVVVTYNYRLASLGFLAHPALSAEDPEGSSGNQGLWDSLEALRWVHDNAAAFGGDPDRIGLFGESSGSVSTCALLSMPQAAGLFSSAVMESGACGFTEQPLSGDAGSFTETAEDFGDRFASAIGCADEADVVACLRSASVEEILATLPAGNDTDGGGGENYGPTVDGVLVPGPARELFSNGDFPSVPVMAGTNGDEATLFTSGFGTDTVAGSQGAVVMLANFGGIDSVAAQEHYHPDNFDSPRDAFDAFWADAIFNCPTRSFVRAASQHTDAWHYGFDLAPSAFSDLGACHGCELFLLFGNLSFGAEEQALTDVMQEAWVSLARDGVPTSAATGDWPLFVPGDSEPYMLLAPPAGADTGWRDAGCDFLDEQGWHQYP